MRWSLAATLWTRRARAFTLSLAAVTAGALTVTGVVAMQPESDQLQAASGPGRSTFEITSTAAFDGVSATDVATSAEVDVRRGAVGVPGDYAGTLAEGAPPAAIAAYQRADAIINAASKCHLDWTLLAAIGRVESNHSRGQRANYWVTERGVAKPAIVGEALDGRQGRGRLADTDAGVFDQDKTWDAPIGAMGLLPSTWKLVAVDADGDSLRNPQDIDDAALGAAVYLCAGERNLSRPTVLREALTAYHRAPRFVSTVLAVQARYAEESTVTTFAPPADIRMPSDMPDLCDCEGLQARRGGLLGTQPKETSKAQPPLGTPGTPRPTTTPTSPRPGGPTPSQPPPTGPDPTGPSPTCPEPDDPSTTDQPPGETTGETTGPSPTTCPTPPPEPEPTATTSPLPTGPETTP